MTNKKQLKLRTMKKLLFVMLFPLLGFSQSLENVDYISPYQNEVAAVKKGDKWAFVDKKGTLVINFRNDLVSTKTDNANYPIFSNERCLISNEKDGIAYYGYIDKSGKTVIEPQFLNAINFKENAAIVLKLVKEESSGMNELMKNIVSYHYFEVVIDKDGKISQYLSEDPIHITLTKEKMRNPPVITSRIISDNLIKVRSKDKQWTVKKVNN
jgi:hypothetical protein